MNRRRLLANAFKTVIPVGPVFVSQEHDCALLGGVYLANVGERWKRFLASRITAAQRERAGQRDLLTRTWRAHRCSTIR